MNGYITAQEAAEKWGVTPRQVQILCKENRIPGASRMSRIWVIPENAEKPTSIRHSKGIGLYMAGWNGINHLQQLQPNITDMEMVDLDILHKTELCQCARELYCNRFQRTINFLIQSITRLTGVSAYT